MDPSNNQGPRAHGKGKERDESLSSDSAGTQEPQFAENGSKEGDSLASRLQASAAGLSRAIVGGRAGATSMSSSSSEKTQTSSASYIRGPTITERGEVSQSRPRHLAGADTSLRFRDPRSRGTQASPGYDSFLAHHSPSTDGTPVLDAYAASTFGPDRGHAAVVEQQSRDGDEVLDLLSAPDPPELMMDDPAVDPDLSPEEIDMLKKALFGPGQPGTGTPNWDNLLNFQPDFLVAGDDQGVRQHMGVEDTAEGSGLWFNQWSDVLSNYHDEVWGDLGPLAEDARRELEEAKKQPAGSEPGDMKALRRLRQILGQVRGF